MAINSPMSEAEKQGIVNRLELSGWLTSNMVEQSTSTGKHPLKARLCAYKPGRSGNIMCLDITVWPDTITDEIKADYLSLKKGDRVVVTGALEINEWQGRTFVGINASSIEEA